MPYDFDHFKAGMVVQMPYKADCAIVVRDEELNWDDVQYWHDHDPDDDDEPSSLNVIFLTGHYAGMAYKVRHDDLTPVGSIGSTEDLI